jgi:hypothetical protein
VKLTERDAIERLASAYHADQTLVLLALSESQQLIIA